MLRALKKQPNQLAEDSHGQFIAKIEARMGGRSTPEDMAALKNFVLLLPDMIAQIRLWAEDQKVPAEVKGLHGFVLTYLYHPLDLIPEEPYGLFGYLDDAYLVGDVYHRTMMYVKSDFQARDAQGSFSANIGRWLHLTRKVLPKETTIIDGLLNELVKGNASAFHNLVAQTETSAF